MEIQKKIEAEMKRTIRKYKVCSKDEKILIALSGGKDSGTVAYLLKKFGYHIEGFHINLEMGVYSKKCLEAVKKLSKDLNIPLHVYDIKEEFGSSMCYIRSTIQSSKSLKNCAICGVIKKWILNKEARRLKADKIATGHNLDDEVQTFLLNVLKGNLELSRKSGPITKGFHDKKFIQRIKPLFFVLEDDIREYSKKMKFPVVYEKCPCALDSYRITLRAFTNKLPGSKKKNVIKNFEKIIVKSEKLKDADVNYCEICREPARNKVCKRCELMNVKA